MTLEAVIVPARLEHAFVLATTLRPKDVAELDACGLSPLEGLLQSLRASEVACAALYDDVVGALFGVEPIDDGSLLGRPDRLWFLTGELFAVKPMAFFRAARQVVATLLERYPVLTNVIDARHDDALRFARAMGAELGRTVPFGPAAMPFVPFVIRRR